MEIGNLIEVDQHTEKKNHLATDQDILANQVQTHCMRLQESHEETNQHLVIGLPALVGDHEAKGKLLVRDKVATSLPGADKRK